MGYLSQALYQTKPIERSKLVKKSLENLIKSFYLIKENSKEKDNQLHNIPLPLLGTIINFWFNENFKSITLNDTLSISFSDIFSNDENSFDSNFKLLMIATTLMNPYIDKEDCMMQLLDRKEFLNNPLLSVVADMAIELGKINQHNVSKDIKNELIKNIRRKRDYIKLILKEPAHRFNDNFLLEE
jgi:hypothetical protein